MSQTDTNMLELGFLLFMGVCTYGGSQGFECADV